MKKLIASLVAALALAASAEPQKVAVVRLADATGMTGAAGRICTMIGNPMFVGYASQAISQWELYTFFGTPRGGLPITLPVFADLDKLDSETPEFAILFPIDGRESFLARFKDVQEKDGMQYVEKDGNTLLRKVYLLFSDDGKWVAACDKPQFATMALGCVADAKPLDGGVLSASVCGKFLGRLIDLASKEAEKKNGSQVLTEQYRRIIGGVEGLSIDVGVGDDGVTMRGAIKTSAGSDLAKVGQKRHGADVFAQATSDALSLEAYAEDAFGSPKREMIKVAMDFIASKGFKTDFLNAIQKTESFTCCIDLPALVKYIEGEGGETFSKLDPDACVAEWNKATGAIDYKVEGPAYSASMAIKGFKPKFPLSQRFAKTIPEVSGKPLCTLTVSSFYTFARAVATQLADTQAGLAEFKPMLATLPEDGVGAIASACWREGDDLRYVARISSDEIRSVGTAANLAIGAVMAQAMSAMSACDDDDDDCDDDEDCDCEEDEDGED